MISIMPAAPVIVKCAICGICLSDTADYLCVLFFCSL